MPGSFVRALAFSDLHRDLGAARGIVERSREADVELVIGAGDFATMHEGLEETIGVLSAIETPAVLVAGNNESDAALRRACGTSPGWPAAIVLHGESVEVAGVTLFGLGGRVTRAASGWSFDLSEEEAEAKLALCPPGAILVAHTPPYGHLDGIDRHLGSMAILRAIERIRPPLMLCGHIHECWGQEATIDATRVLNLGPSPSLLNL